MVEDLYAGITARAKELRKLLALKYPFCLDYGHISSMSTEFASESGYSKIWVLALCYEH